MNHESWTDNGRKETASVKKGNVQNSMNNLIKENDIVKTITIDTENIFVYVYFVGPKQNITDKSIVCCFFLGLKYAHTHALNCARRFRYIILGTVSKLKLDVHR